MPFTNACTICKPVPFGDGWQVINEMPYSLPVQVACNRSLLFSENVNFLTYDFKTWFWKLLVLSQLQTLFGSVRQHVVYIFTASAGMCMGLLYTVGVDIAGAQYTSLATGMLSLSCGVSATITGPISGKHNCSYNNIAFICS